MIPLADAVQPVIWGDVILQDVLAQLSLLPGQVDLISSPFFQGLFFQTQKQKRPRKYTRTILAVATTQPNNLVLLCKFQIIIIIYFLRN